MERVLAQIAPKNKILPEEEQKMTVVFHDSPACFGQLVAAFRGCDVDLHDSMDKHSAGLFSDGSQETLAPLHQGADEQMCLVLGSCAEGNHLLQRGHF